MLTFCESHYLDDALGLTSNERLALLATSAQMDACLKFKSEEYRAYRIKLADTIENLLRKGPM